MVIGCSIEFKELDAVPNDRIKKFINHALLNAGFNLDKEYSYSDDVLFNCRVYRQYVEEDKNEDANL